MFDGDPIIVDLRRRKKHRIAQNVRNAARERLMLAQGGICAHCEEPFPEVYEPNRPDSPTIEHVMPVSRGGKSTIDNLLLKHGACNEACGNAPPSKRDRKWQAIVAAALPAIDEARRIAGLARLQAKQASEEAA